MGQKLLSAAKKGKTAISPRKVVAEATKNIVLVGTYKEKQLAWIAANGVYNYPVKNGDEFDAATFAKIGELWLYADVKSTRHCFKARFDKRMTYDEFVAAHPTYAKLGKLSHTAYYVFNVSKVDYGTLTDGQFVFARADDFTKARGRTKKLEKAIEQFKADGEFAPLAAYLPSDLAKVPSRQLRVCEAAVQLEFSSLMSSKIKAQPSQAESDVASCLRTSRIAMSLFSGAGGLDIGVLQAGFDVLSCVELDHNACDTLRRAVLTEHRRTKVYEGDIKSISPEQLLADLGRKPGEVDLLFGGPPCQAFSLIGKQKALDDERGMLLFQMIRYTRVIRPRVVLMEQVKGLLSAKDAYGKRGGVFEMLLRDFEELGYVVKYKVCLAADYGAAQLRERVILVATLDKNGFQFPAAKYQDPSKPSLFGNLPPWRTVGDVLSGLGRPHMKEKGVTVYADSFNNHVDVTPERDRERIRCVPEGLYLASQTHLPPDILGNLKSRDTTKYLRLSRNRPSNTLRCGEIFFHPTEDRYLTPREYMRIHGYPDNYILEGPIRSRTGSVKNLDQHRQVANSVPPPLACAIAEQIMSYLENS